MHLTHPESPGSARRRRGREPQCRSGSPTCAGTMFYVEFPTCPEPAEVAAAIGPVL